ncbi:MAG: AAA family ATPase [Microbacteriaceae bacterium]|nr:AAA family ATPase [Microbacteriaceae bacterium]
MREEFLWVEAYRPKTIADTILPKQLKTTFQKFVDDNNVPNLLLTGRAGIGKTTVARAILDQLQSDYIVINGSLHGNIDTLRNDILAFASTVSFSGGRKYVILDEADYLNPNSTQPALRNFMEEYSKNCGFILTCNFKNKLIEPLWSRCSVVEFKIPKDERPNLASQFFKRICTILDKENVNYVDKVVAEIIQKFFPDFRRTLNELQRYAATGSIDTGILTNFSDQSFKTLIEHMKKKDFTNVRKWVGENNDIEPVVLFRRLYDSASTMLANNASVAQLVMIIANYQYKSAFVADQEINTTACMAELMVNVEWK